MAYQFYAKIRGQKSGAIAGSVTQKGRENQIACFAITHSIVSPRDPASGLPTGRRQHKPIVITKAWDKSTPVLLNSLFTNEVLVDCQFLFWRSQVAAGIGVAGEVQYMTIELTNASIASIDQYTASPDQLNQFNANDLEDISFTYQKIIITYNDGGITAQDDWQAQV